MRNFFILPFFFISLILSGCSIDISQSSGMSPSPQAVPAIPLTVPTASNSGMATQENANPTSPPPHSITVTKVPVTWTNLKLTGRMAYISANVQQGNPILSIQILDLITGESSSIFDTTGESWIYYMAASPIHNQVLMSYAPPLGYNSPSQQAIYILPLDGSQIPQLLFTPPTQDDQYLQAEWSPDGKYVYYVHSSDKPQYQGQLYPIYELFRMAYPNGQGEKIAENAFWPRLSPDSSQLVYISSDPTDGKNKIFLANPDGSNARQVVMTGSSVPDIIDAPIFSPDGESILFSAPPPAQAYQPNWVERLFGIQVAEAHTIPSDWWLVPLSGGTPRQLTHIASPVLFASVSPDGKLIASYSGSGLFVMHPDGTGLTTLIPDLGGLAGMVSWLP